MTKPIRKPANETTCCNCSSIHAPTLGIIEVSHGMTESVNFFSQEGSWLPEVPSIGGVFVLLTVSSVATGLVLATGSERTGGWAGKIFCHREVGDVHSATL